MMNLNTIKIIILLACLGIGIATYYFLVPNKTSLIEIASKTNLDTDFSDAHFSVINKDTFQTQLIKAYGNLIEVKNNQKTLDVQFVNANQIALDFYNGNTKLLKLKLNDYGFQINHSNAEANNISASFKIEDGYVNVPNDVLISIVEKNSNK